MMGGTRADYRLRVASIERGWSHDYAPAAIVFTGDDDARRWAIGFQRALGDEYRCALMRDGAVILDCGRPTANNNADLFGDTHA